MGGNKIGGEEGKREKRGKGSSRLRPTLLERECMYSALGSRPTIQGVGGVTLPPLIWVTCSLAVPLSVSAESMGSGGPLSCHQTRIGGVSKTILQSKVKEGCMRGGEEGRKRGHLQLRKRSAHD